MKTSYNWLKEYVSIPWSPEELAENLTMIGLEVEEIARVNDFPKTVVIARIVSKKQHPNAEKLTLCEVDDSTGEVLQVVCGAPNCFVGSNVVLAKIGTKLPDGSTIRKAKIRGEHSYGMLCSEKELNLGTDHMGIMVLSKDASVGGPLSDYLGADTTIDWEVTPNRSDWLSHIGIAREIAALTKTPLNIPQLLLEEADDSDVEDFISVEVRDQLLCPRYTARVIKNVKVGPSPNWLQNFLRAVGMRPINNIVDITNFILLECGQPLHAFDLDKLSGNKIIVRRAQEKESLLALNQELYELSPEHLVIADENRCVALAGIIGGGNSEITEDTRDILIESAAFEPVNIRKTARHLGVSTESSHRFERGVDTEMVKFASGRAAQLICDYTGGQLAKGFRDIGTVFKPNEIFCRFDRVNRVLGVPIKPSFIESTFRHLGLTFLRKEETKCCVSIPSFRKDLTREVDLIEEISRFYGLDKIPVANHLIRVEKGVNRDAYIQIQSARDQLIALGLQECLTNSLVSEKQVRVNLKIESIDHVSLTNPLGIDLSALRQNLLEGMIQVIAQNMAHGNADLRLFEFGRTFHKNRELYHEDSEVCIILTGRKNPERYSGERNETFDFYDLRGLIEDWMAAQRFVNYKVRNTTHPIFERGVCAEVTIKKIKIGLLGELKKELLSHIRIYNPVYASLINFTDLCKCLPPTSRFEPLPQFPSIGRDVTFSANEDLEHQLVVDTIQGVGVKFLEKVELADIFRDDRRIGKGKKSMAYTLTFRSPKRTLSDKEVNQAQEKIRLALIDTLPVQIR